MICRPSNSRVTGSTYAISATLTGSEIRPMSSGSSLTLGCVERPREIRSSTAATAANKITLTTAGPNATQPCRTGSRCASCQPHWATRRTTTAAKTRYGSNGCRKHPPARRPDRAG